MEKGAKTWRYLPNYNPTKTKGYEESLTSVQFSGTYDLNDMKNFKKGFRQEVCYKDVRRFTNMGKKEDVISPKGKNENWKIVKKKLF